MLDVTWPRSLPLSRPRPGSLFPIFNRDCVSRGDRPGTTIARSYLCTDRPVIRLPPHQSHHSHRVLPKCLVQIQILAKVTMHPRKRARSPILHHPVLPRCIKREPSTAPASVHCSTVQCVLFVAQYVSCARAERRLRL